MARTPAAIERARYRLDGYAQNPVRLGRHAAKVLVYRRHGASGEDVLVAVNLRNRAYARYDFGVRDGGVYRVRLTSDRAAYGSDFADASVAPITALAQPYDQKPFTLPIALGAYGVVVLSR